jgi:exopolysaccharide production protein ExoZ
MDPDLTIAEARTSVLAASGANVMHSASEWGDDRVRSLDFLRGVAILGVVAFHVVLSFGPRDNAASTLAGLGVYGVQLFFVISALTMCLMWLRRAAESHAVTKFYVRRFFRIAPPFWLAIVGYTAMNGMGPSRWSPDGIELRQLLATSAFMHGIWPDTINTVVPGGWSIAVEMMFYATFPLISAVELSALALGAAAFATYLLNITIVEPLLSVVFSDQSPKLLSEFLYFQFFNQAPIFLIGMAVFRLLSERKEDRLVALILCWIIVAFALKFGLSIHASPFFWLAVSALAIFAWLSLRYGVSLGPINFFGQVSYSIYLSHFAVIQFAEFAFREMSLNNHTLASFGAALILVLALCSAVGALLRKTIEAWSSKLGKLFIRKFVDKPTGHFPND